MKQGQRANGSHLSSDQSPVEYASNQLEGGMDRATSYGGSGAYQGGKVLAKKASDRIKTKIRSQKASDAIYDAGHAGEEGTEVTGTRTENPNVMGNQEKGNRDLKSRRNQTSAGERIDSRIKTREFLEGKGKKPFELEMKKQEQPFSRSAKLTGIDVKQAGKFQKAAQKTNQAKKQAEHAYRAGKKLAIEGKRTAVRSAKGIRKAVHVIKAAVKTTITAVKSFTAFLAAGGWVVVLLVIFLGVIGGIGFSSSNSSSEPLSQEVLAYTPTIQKYASQYGIPEYVASIQAIMMQESGGRGTDPMQSSECPYNTRYPNSPGAIQDPEYSIQVGIQYYAACVQEAACESPLDMGKLQLSWQGYNYGNGYISWAIRKYGGYSLENALQFSQEQAASHGWTSYGDPEYVPHVQRYYSGGSIFDGLFGNGQIVSIAKSQLGNEGGMKFWSWYGFPSREEWCACFVSWCADQAGLIQRGAIPKFSLCTDGVEWFQEKGRWQNVGSIPTPGTLIFFDWDYDGESDHVGIVELCDGSTIYTIEGNSGDAVRQNSYVINSEFIMGYGIIS